MPDVTLIKNLSTTAASFIVVFGALPVWPVMKFVVRLPPERLCVLKWIFLLQVFWLLVSLAAIHYYHAADMTDWLRDSVYPYIIGAVSWLTVIAALLSLGISRKRKTG